MGSLRSVSFSGCTVFRKTIPSVTALPRTSTIPPTQNVRRRRRGDENQPLTTPRIEAVVARAGSMPAAGSAVERVGYRGRRVRGPVVDEPPRAELLHRDVERLRLLARSILRQQRDGEANLFRMRPVEAHGRARDRGDVVRDDRDLAGQPLLVRQALLD